jgi:hypothetical protein
MPGAVDEKYFMVRENLLDSEYYIRYAAEVQELRYF